MKLSLAPMYTFLDSLSRRASFIGLLVGIGCASWLLWQVWEQWVDRPLPPERLTAKQLRVNETQRQTLIENLELYRQPTNVPSLPSITFRSGGS